VKSGYCGTGEEKKPWPSIGEPTVWKRMDDADYSQSDSLLAKRGVEI